MLVYVRKIKDRNESPDKKPIIGSMETSIMPAISGKIKFKNKNYTIVSIDIEQNNERRKIINVIEG